MFTLKNKRNYYDWIVNSYFLINIKNNTKYTKYTQLSLYLATGLFYYLKYINLFIQFETLKYNIVNNDYYCIENIFELYIIKIINRLIINNISNYYQCQSIIFKHWLTLHLEEFIVYMPKKKMLDIIKYITSILKKTSNMIKLQNTIQLENFINIKFEDELLLETKYYKSIFFLNKLLHEATYTKYNWNIKKILKNIITISKKKPFFSKKHYFDYNYYKLSLFLLSTYGYSFKTLKLFYNKYKDKYFLKTFNDFFYLLTKKIDHFFNLYFNITNEELQFIIKTKKLIINNQIIENTNFFITDIMFIEFKSNNIFFFFNKKFDYEIFSYKKWYIINYFFFVKSMIWNKNFYNNLIINKLKKNIICLVLNITDVNSNSLLTNDAKFKNLRTNIQLFKSTVLHIIDIIPIIYYKNILQHKYLEYNLNSLTNINIVKYFITTKNSTILTISKYKNFSTNLIKYIQKINDLYNILYIIYKFNNNNYKFYINYIIYIFLTNSVIQQSIIYIANTIIKKNKIENYFNLYNIQYKETLNIKNTNDYLIMKMYNKFYKIKTKKKKTNLKKLINKIRTNKDLIKSYDSDIAYKYDDTKIFLESKLIYDELKKYKNSKNIENNIFFVNEYKYLYKQLYNVLSYNNNKLDNNKFIYSKKNFYYINILPKKNNTNKNWFNNYFINNYKNKLMNSFF